MKIIILAAGCGTRFINSNKSIQIPKCLIKLKNHKTILELNLENIQTCDSIESINIVTGYKYNLVEKHLGDLFPNEWNINLLYNSDYQKSVIHSVLKGFENIDNTSSILLLNGDTYFEKDIFIQANKISHQCQDTITLFGHITNEFYDDDMLLHVIDRKILNIGKNLKKANGISSGAILLCNDGLKKYVETIKNKSIQKLNTHHGIINEIIKSSYTKIGFVDIGLRQWIDIDNQKDLKNVQENFYKD